MSLGLAQANTVDDARMVERVGDDSVLVAQNGLFNKTPINLITSNCVYSPYLEQTGISVEAGWVQDRVVHAVESCDFALQVLVNILSSANEAN